MQNVKCSQCGTEVRVAGLGAICPQCGVLVTAGTMLATPVESAPEPEILDLTEVPPPPPDPLTSPIDAPTVFRPFRPEPTPSSRGLYLAIGFLGLLVVVLVGLVLALLLQKPKTVVITAPAPAPTVTPAPAPRGSEWFSDSPRPVTPPPTPAQPPAPRPQVTPIPATTPATVAGGRTPATVPVVRVPVHPHARLALLKPVASAADARSITDEQISTAITRGMAFLLSQFNQTRLRNIDNHDLESFQGLNALAVYSLIQCGKYLNDPRLGPQSDMVKGMLDRIKEYPMNGNRATYSRSLRISALTVHMRSEDRAKVQEDLQYLLKSTMAGAYSYEMPPDGRTRDMRVWDNSNSQYGALGVWAAAEAGFPVPQSYWQAVEQHWASSQLLSGGWAYMSSHTPATLSMTVAGTNMLFVARDQLSNVTTNPTTFPSHSANLGRALEWLDDGDNAVIYNTDYRGYILYSLERAALAGGFRYLGKHDWYTHFARELIQTQRADGSWTSTIGNVAETAFDLVFLVCGRQPVLYSKLRFDGSWQNRPREVNTLTRYTSHQLERPHTWQVADLRREWRDWTDAPVLMITSDQSVALPDSGIEKIRQFALNGGLVFFHAERDAPEFRTSAVGLIARAFPEYPLTPLPPTHEVYSAAANVEQKPPLMGVSNGARLLALYSPNDITRLWLLRPTRAQRHHSDVGMNIGVYANGRRNVGSRLQSAYVLEPSEPPKGLVPLARLRYAGNWNPEPAGWPRTSRVLRHATSIGLNILPTEIAQLEFESAPLAHLTGTEAVRFGDPEVTALRQFLNRGGVLLIDACGGSNAFADSIQSDLLPRLSGGAAMVPLPPDHPISVGFESPPVPLPRIQLRENLPGEDAAPRLIRVGAGAILFTPQDLSCGLVGTNALGIRGYQPPWCQAFVRNLVLWIIQQVGPPPPP